MPKLFVTPKKSSRKVWIVAIVVFVLLAAGVGGYYYWSSTQKATPIASEDPSIKKIDDTSLAAEINSLLSRKEYDKAQKLIEYQDGGTTDPSKVAMLANISAEKGETDVALKILSDAAEKNPDEAYYFKGHEARIIADTGDVATALTKYQEAIDLAGKIKAANDTEAFLTSRRVADYEWEIDQLKGTQ